MRAAIYLLGAVLVSTAAAAEGPLERGREHLAAGRFADSERELREALRLEPDSPVAGLYLGQALGRQGRHAEAAAVLERARDADPDLPAVDLSLGASYFELDRHEAARDALARAVERDAESGSALLLLGLCELELGDPAKAAEHFERARRVDAELSQLALYNLAIARSRGGDAAGAALALRRSIGVAPTSSTAGHARALLDRVERPARGTRRWSLGGSVGVLHDDNVTTRELDSSSGEGDGAAVAELAASYRLGDDDADALELGYDFYQRAYFDASDFNLQVHSLSARATHSLSAFDATLGYRYTLSTLGSDRFLEIHELRPGVELALSPRWYTVAGLDLRRKRFDDVPRRDASQRGLGAESFYFFRQNRAYVLAGARLERENADGPELDYAALVLRAGLHLPLQLGSESYEVDLGYRYQQRDYDHVTPSIGERRDDRIHTLRARLTRLLGERYELRLDLEYTDSDSNLPVADYLERVAGISLAFDFD